MVGGRRPPYSMGAQGESAVIERNSMLGTYRAMFPASLPVDFVHINDLAAGKANHYKLIYVPYPLMIDEPAGRAMREYVRQGGSLVSEARLAWNDDRGRATEIIPGFGLHEVCNCRETAIQQSATGKTEMSLAMDFAGLTSGAKIRGTLYQETLEPLSAAGTVVARFADGTPGMVSSTFGKGKMLAIGTFLGTAFESDRDETLGRFLRGLPAWAGVRNPVDVSDPDIEIRMLQSGQERLVFVFNHAEAAKTANFGLALAGRVRDVETGQAVNATVEGGMLRIQRDLPANGVAVLAVR
jgi:beta-galactosidase